jgi:hypothetical protein
MSKVQRFSQVHYLFFTRKHFPDTVDIKLDYSGPRRTIIGSIFSSFCPIIDNLCSKRLFSRAALPDWANFRMSGDCLLWPVFLWKILVTFFHGESYVSICTKIAWATFRPIFHKLIWSPCFREYQRRQQQLDLRPILAIFFARIQSYDRCVQQML